MRNLCNKANMPYLLAGAFATLTLIASGALVAAPYVGFLSSVAAFNVALPIALSLSILSVLALALSYKMISNSKEVDVEKNKFAQREQELENKVTLEKEATSRVRQLTEENRYLKSDIEKLNEIKDQLEKQLTYAQKKSEDELSGMKKQKEIIERQAEEQKIRVQQELNQKTQGLDDVKQQLETSNKNIGVMQKKVDELRGKLKESEDYCKKLQEVLEAKHNELDNVKEQKVELERKLENMWNLEYSNDSYVKFQEALKVEQDKVELLEGQISQIEASTKQAIEFYELSGNDLRNVEGSASVGSKFEEFLILLSTDDTEKRLRLRVLTEENQDLKDQLGNLEEKVALSKDLESSLLDTCQQLYGKIQEKEVAEKKMKESDEREVVARRDSIKRSKEVRELLQEALSMKDAEKKVEKLKAEVERMKIDLGKLSQDLSQEMSSRKAAEEKCGELDEILSCKTQYIDELERRITELEDESLSRMDELSQQYIENRHLSESLERLENKVGKGESGVLEVMAAKTVEDECEGASKLLVGGEQSKTELEEEVQLQGGLQQVNASEAEDEQSRKDSNEELEDLLIKSDDQGMKALVSSAKESRERDKLDSESYEFLCESGVKNQLSSEESERLENGVKSLSGEYKKGESSRSEAMVTKIVEVEDECEGVSKLLVGGEQSKTELEEEVQLQGGLQQVNASEAEDEQLKKDSNEELKGLLRKLNQKVGDSEKRLKELQDENKSRDNGWKGLRFTGHRGANVLREIKEGENLSVGPDKIIEAKGYLTEQRRNLEGQIRAYCKSCGGLNRANNLLVQRIRDLEKELNKNKDRTRMQRNSSRSDRFSDLQIKVGELSEKLEKLKKEGKQAMSQRVSREDLSWLDTVNSSTLHSQGKKVAKIIDNIIEMDKSLEEKITDFNRLCHRLETLNTNLNRELAQIEPQKKDNSLSSQISSAHNISEIESTLIDSSECSSDVSESTAKKDLLGEKSLITSTPSRPCEGLKEEYFGIHLSLIQQPEVSLACNSISGKLDQSLLESQDQNGLKRKNETKGKNRTPLRKKEDKENLSPQSQKNRSMSNGSVSPPLMNTTNVTAISVNQEGKSGLLSW